MQTVSMRSCLPAFVHTPQKCLACVMEVAAACAQQAYCGWRMHPTLSYTLLSAACVPHQCCNASQHIHLLLIRCTMLCLVIVSAVRQPGEFEYLELRQQHSENTAALADPCAVMFSCCFLCRCPNGTTTGATKATSAASCTLYAPGWGAEIDGSTARCPLGTFSDGTNSAASKSACSKCPEGRTTPETGATSATDCSLCAAGYGGASPQSCKPCVDGYYNPLSGRILDTTRCLACPVSRVFSFPWNGDNDFVPLATSPAGATSQGDCLADFSQTVDGAFFLDLQEGPEFKSADAPGASGSWQVRFQRACNIKICFQQPLSLPAKAARACTAIKKNGISCCVGRRCEAAAVLASCTQHMAASRQCCGSLWLQMPYSKRRPVSALLQSTATASFNNHNISVAAPV